MSVATERRFIIARGDLSPMARLLALRIMDLQNLEMGCCLLSAEGLADELGTSSRTIRRALAELRATGMLAEDGGGSKARRVTVAGRTYLSVKPDTSVTPPHQPGADTSVRGGGHIRPGGRTDLSPREIDLEIDLEKESSLSDSGLSDNLAEESPPAPERAPPDPRPREVFEHWVSSTWNGRGRKPQFSDERKRKIKTALKTFEADELMRAIDGIQLSDLHAGRVPNRPRYNDLVRNVLKNTTEIERWIAAAEAGHRIPFGHTRNDSIAPIEHGDDDDRESTRRTYEILGLPLEAAS